MGWARQYAAPGLMIRRIPEDRRRRMARFRTLALIAIGAVALSGMVLQEAHDRTRPAEAQIASAPGAFEYFPG